MQTMSDRRMQAHSDRLFAFLRHSVVERLGLCFLLAALACASGCASTKARPWVPDRHNKPDAALSLIFPGDEVQLSFVEAADLNTTQIVQRDGKLNLGLIGEVEAAGKTPDALRKEILKRYGNQLLTQEATIVVRANAPVFVMGAVKTPRRVPQQHAMTVLEAIADAGGFDETQAQMRNVIVIRHEDGKHFGTSLDLRPTVAGEDAPVFYLRPMDIVYVPRTRIVRVNQWIDQHINRIIPSLGVGFNTSGDVYFGL